MNKLFSVLALAVVLATLGFCVEPVKAVASSEPFVSQAVAAQTVLQAPAPKPKTPDRIQANKVLTITMFCIVIVITMGVVVWAAKRTTTSADFYAARGAITGTQNGWAIAGDFMSAASFLGVAGLISLVGFDGIMYAVGAQVAFVTVLLLIAEPCRNSGKYTVGDIVSFRSSPRPVRASIALTTVLLSTFYLIVQMVGAGKLMELLLGIPFPMAIAGVGALMIVYVVFGGMIATTWVQIIKAVLLMFGAVVLFLLVAAKVGFNPMRFFSQVAGNQNIQDWVQVVMLKQGVPTPGFDYGQRFLEPGLFMKNAWDQLSLSMAFLLGTAGMPHILMRFFTVPDARAARKSVVIAMFLIGIFFIMTTILGFASALFVSPQLIAKVDKGGNMANLLLAQTLGNEITPWLGDALLAFLCAVAFATILAVVSGLVLAAAGAIAHDIYVSLIKKGKAEQREQVMAARITSFFVGLAAIVIGMLCEKANVAHLATLAFALAASGNLPAVVLSLFWRKMNTAGICGALLVGTIVSLGLLLVSPNMDYPKVTAAGAKAIMEPLEKKQAEGTALTETETATLKKAQADFAANKDGTSIMGLDKPWFPLKNPAIVSIPIGFAAAIILALLFPCKKEEDAFDELYVRQNTGIGMAKAIKH
jgi:cation/acetate symporter